MVAWYVSTDGSDYTYSRWIDHGVEDIAIIVYSIYACRESKKADEVGKAQVPCVQYECFENLDVAKPSLQDHYPDFADCSREYTDGTDAGLRAIRAPWRPTRRQMWMKAWTQKSTNIFLNRHTKVLTMGRSSSADMNNVSPCNIGLHLHSVSRFLFVPFKLYIPSAQSFSFTLFFPSSHSAQVVFFHSHFICILLLDP